MSNHLHLVLRNRPDIAEQWSADEIALRWCRVFPPRDDATGEPVEPGEHDLAILTADSDRLDENTPLETCERPDAWLCELTLQETATEPASTTAVGAASPLRESASEAGPVAIAVAIADAVGASEPSADFRPPAGVAAPRRLHARASDQGFLPIEVEHYVMLLDWTGRELRADKRGAIPDHLAPIVERLGLNRSNWVETVRGFGRLFKQAAGRSSSLVDAAARRSRRWFQGKAAARTAFV